eukprot:SAG11_NODE_1817_length_4215_cov_1.788630_4_plen_532_part_00
MSEYKRLAAKVNEELRARRIRWKTYIKPMRERQREILGQLCQRGGRGCKFATWMRSNAAEWNRFTKARYYSQDTTKIYVRVCPFMPNERYVGIHKGVPDSRDSNHLLLSQKSSELEPSETLFHQKFAATHGGPGMFVDMPLYVCPLDVERSDALRLERWYYTRFGTHNAKPGRQRAGARHDNDRTQRRRKPPRRRPVLSIRTDGSKFHSVNNTSKGAAPQMYSVAGQRSSCDFSAIVRRVEKTGGGAVVQISAGSAELSNTALLRQRYGDTRVLVTCADDFQIMTNIKTMMSCKMLRCTGIMNQAVHAAVSGQSQPLPALEPVRHIEIVEVIWTPWSTDAASAYQMAEQVGKHPAFSRTLMTTVTHSELVRIWNATKAVKDKRIRRRAEEQLNGISKKKFQISLICEPTISYPASVYFPKVLIRRAGVRLLRRIEAGGGFNTVAMRRLEGKLRAVRSRAETVGQVLVNHRKYDNAYDPVRPHTCTCHLYPKQWRRVRQFGGHFCVLSAEYDGPGAEGLHCSHKTPTPSRTR